MRQFVDLVTWKPPPTSFKSGRGQEGGGERIFGVQSAKSSHEKCKTFILKSLTDGQGRSGLNCQVLRLDIGKDIGKISTLVAFRLK